MKRDAEKILSSWLTQQGRKPLVIRGARQVGKSTLVRQFAESSGLVLHEINLEKNAHLDTVFKKLDMGLILDEIAMISGKGPINDKGLLFLDEIQAAPHALQALRYFYEERPGIPVIAAGSLLEFVFSGHSFSMPVGRIEYLFLHPMTFTEYLEARNQGALVKYMEEYSQKRGPLETAHDRLLAELRNYLIIGGMPEAVKRYTATGDIGAAAAVHASILQTFQDDFSKYAEKEELVRLQRVFHYVPSAVGEKVKYSNINPLWKAREVREAIDLLALAGVIHRIHHADAPAAPLSASADDQVFKPLFLDVGLMNAVLGIRAIGLEAFASRRFINEGGMAEQFVGQHLLTLQEKGFKPQLFYWLREGMKNNAEVDYLWQESGSIFPVEVKAGKSGSLRSLLQFILARSPSLAIRFDLNQPSFQSIRQELTDSAGRAACGLLSIPLYMAEQMPRLVRERLA